MRASIYKFEAQADAYFSNKTWFTSRESMKNSVYSLTSGDFCALVERVSDPHKRISLPNYQLVECIIFEGEFLYLTAIVSFGSFIELEPSPIQSPEVSGISLSLICNEEPRYLDFLHIAIKHYEEVLELFDFEICVAFFGEGEIFLGEHTKTKTFPSSDFNMAYARNRSLEMCTKSHSLMVSLDCLLSKEQLLDLSNEIPNTNGIINFCRPTFSFPGNALFLGETKKLQDNGHCEEFKGFFFEDTEFLMNFSRTGIIPWCYFVDFDYIDHSRKTTMGWFSRNQKVFERILKEGRREIQE